MIEAQEKEIELVVTYDCNWHCDYCCVDTHNKPEITLEDLQAKLEKVTPGYNVTLSGGEVGMLSYNKLAMIIDKLQQKNCPISLNTNGLFLDKYPELIKHFEYILYHCSEDLIKSPKEYSIPFGAKLEYMLVVTDNNIHRLEMFLHQHKATTFHVVAATQPEDGLDVTLSNENRYAIMAKRYNNISKESLNRLIVKEKEFDSIIYI